MGRLYGPRGPVDQDQGRTWTRVGPADVPERRHLPSRSEGLSFTPVKPLKDNLMLNKLFRSLTAKNTLTDILIAPRKQSGPLPHACIFFTRPCGVLPRSEGPYVHADMFGHGSALRSDQTSSLSALLNSIPPFTFPAHSLSPSLPVSLSFSLTPTHTHPHTHSALTEFQVSERTGELSRLSNSVSLCCSFLFFFFFFTPEGSLYLSRGRAGEKA